MDNFLIVKNFDVYDTSIFHSQLVCSQLVEAKMKVNGMH